MQVQSSVSIIWQHRDVHLLVLDLLSIGELRAYGLVSKDTYHVMKVYLETISTLRPLLTRFIREDSVRAFRRMQRATGTLIGGSAALQFFTRLDFPSSDLDLYVHMLYAAKVVTALRKMRCVRFVYKVKPKAAPKVVEMERGYMGPGMKEVLNFRSPTGRKIQLIVTDRRPVDVILNYHSTVVMNFLTGWYAYCLYPKETLEEGRTIYVRHCGDDLYDIKDKWDHRGWQEVECQSEAQALGLFAPSSRLVGDDRTSVVKLGADGGIKDASYKDTFVREAAWLLGYSQAGKAYVYTS